MTGTSLKTYRREKHMAKFAGNAGLYASGDGEISEDDARKLYEIEKRFIDAYKGREESDTEGRWLSLQLKKELPEKTESEAQAIAHGIIAGVSGFGENLEDINSSRGSGITNETWFAGKMAEAAKGASVTEFGNYLSSIDAVLENANVQMMRTVTTNSGELSQCMNLDGFIAEQNAVNTFNRQAVLKGSPYRAEVKVPRPGETYGKNSFDIVIKHHPSGKIVHQYQSKFGKDADSTIKMLKEGNYNNQRFLVPSEQVPDVQKAFPGKSVEAYIGGTETVPVKSGTLSKAEAKQMQEDVQGYGAVPEQDWNSFNTKELALNVGKKVGVAGLQAATITAGFMLAEKALNGEDIPIDETVEAALVSGTDAGIKAATAGAVHVGAEKGILRIIPKGTPVFQITNVVCVAIEDAKIFLKVAKGEMTLAEGMDNIAKTTVSMSYGLLGAEIGAASMLWIPVVGPVIGGLAGGMVGYMAGSELGNLVYEGAKKIGNAVKNTVSKAWEGIKTGVTNILTGVISLFC